MIQKVRPDIAIVMPSLEGGGAERVMALLASGIARRGLAVDLVLLQKSGPYLQDLDEKVTIREVGSTSVLRSVPALTRYFKTTRPKAVLSALTHMNIAVALSHRLASCDARLVVSERLSLQAARQYHRGWKDRVMRSLMSSAYRRADLVVVVAQDMVRELSAALSIDSERICCIYNPVVNTSLDKQAQERCPHPWFDPDSTIPVVLGCGRLSFQKDFSTLIQAFELLRARHRARLVILGDGEDRELLEQQIAQSKFASDMALPGFAANPFPYMAAAGVFALSSRYEGLPGTLIQAMACGAQVVSTDCPTGPHEILEDGKWGALVPVEHPAAMALSLEKALENEPIDVRARARAFHEDTAIDRYLAALGFGSDRQGSDALM